MIFGSLSLLLGMKIAMVVPGQFESALALSTFFTNHAHQCTCVPKVCSWSDALSACTSKAADSDSYRSGMMIEATPLVGFKCMEESSGSRACRLEQCDLIDFT